MGESRAYQRLKKMYPPPRTHWQRLESWTGTGIFDVNACSLGREIWVECKEAHIRKRDLVILAKVRPAQIAWEHLRREAGGRTFVAFMLGSALCIIPGEFLKNLSVGLPASQLPKIIINADWLFK